MVLLYGTRVGRLTQLRLRDIQIEDGVVEIHLGDVPLVLPEELAEIAVATMHSRSTKRMFGPAEDTDWLFTGSRPGLPISQEALTDRIRKLGVQPSLARTGAFVSMSQQLPAPIIARLTGLHPSTAARWIDAVSASQANYVSARQFNEASANQEPSETTNESRK